MNKDEILASVGEFGVGQSLTDPGATFEVRYTTRTGEVVPRIRTSQRQAVGRVPDRHVHGGSRPGWGDVRDPFSWRSPPVFLWATLAGSSFSAAER